MTKLKSCKGITIVSLVVTIIILLILTGTVIYNTNKVTDTEGYNSLMTDIDLLKDKVLLYYNKYNEIPKTNRGITIDGTNYYEIDLTKLGNITLNFGKDNGKEGEITNSSDIYLINSELNIYYLKGVNKSGNIYHEKV